MKIKTSLHIKPTEAVLIDERDDQNSVLIHNLHGFKLHQENFVGPYLGISREKVSDPDTTKKSTLTHIPPIYWYWDGTDPENPDLNPHGKTLDEFEFTTAGYYFNDETQAHFYGPYKTLVVCEAAATAYGKTL